MDEPVRGRLLRSGDLSLQGRPVRANRRGVGPRPRDVGLQGLGGGKITTGRRGQLRRRHAVQPCPLSGLGRRQLGRDRLVAADQAGDPGFFVLDLRRDAAVGRQCSGAPGRDVVPERGLLGVVQADQGDRGRGGGYQLPGQRAAVAPGAGRRGERDGQRCRHQHQRDDGCADHPPPQGGCTCHDGYPRPARSVPRYIRTLCHYSITICY